jgi:PilZ domain
MTEKRQINGRHVVNDLRSGTGDEELQAKYQLSAKGLQSIFEKLVARGAISHSELCERSSLYKGTTDLSRVRKFRRVDLNVPVAIYDVDTSGTGILRDISEKGLRVAGIESSVGQVKTLQIPIDMFMQADPLLVIAECKWIETMGKTKRYPVAGFEIMDLSERDRKALRDFMGVLVLGESGEWKTIG